jgi:hypothetical protein
MLGRCGRRLEFAQSRDRVGLIADALQDFRRRDRAGARQQLHHPETGDAVARIFRPAQEGQHVLDVRRLEKFQAAEFHERNVAPGQLHFQRP